MICPRCGEEKEPGDFPRSRNTKTGYGTYCKRCHSASTREVIQRHYGGSTRHYHLRQRYGLGDDEVKRMVEAQAGRCAICRSSAAEQVDHDHRTGRIRGVLCLECNAGLGAFGDDEGLLFAAVDYLHPTSVAEWLT